jgi:biopolymer transport protein ExbB
VFEVINDGGYFMWPLLLGSALALGVGMERVIYFLGLSSMNREARNCLERTLVSGQTEKALELCGGSGPAQACARAAIENWHQGAEVVEAAMSVQAKEYEPQLHRFLPLLETIVTAAPLIGLLGTITGMMGVFRAVSQKLGADPHANTTGITAGIGEALIATATGILVAVLALLVHNICQSRAEARMTEAEQTAEAIRLAYAKKEKSV